MNTARWISFVALVVAVVGLWSTNGHAQNLNSPFSPAEREAANAGEGEGDRSLLTADGEAQGPTESRELCRCIGEGASPSVSKIREVLNSPLRSTGLDFVDQPLEEVVNFLQDDYGIPVQLDLPALKEMGVGPDAAVTVAVHNISLRSALQLMLRKLGPTYVIRDEVLLITSPEEAESQLITCVYDVTRLVGDTSPKDFDTVIDTIVSCIETQTWAENGGGEAEIRPLKPGLIVVSQTQPVHDKIHSLLTEIDRMRREQPAANDAAVRAEAAEGEPLVTRSYYLQLTGTDKTNNVGSELRDLIVHSMPDQRWTGRLDDGQAVVLSVLPDRIVVRHTQTVHDELQELLRDSGVAALTPAGAKGGGGGIFQADPATGRSLTER